MNKPAETPKRSKEEILADISTLVATKGYIFVLAEIVTRDFFLDVRQVANINWRERVHSNELALLIGIMLKNKNINFQEISREDIEKAIEFTRVFLEELHWTYGYEFGEGLVKKTSEQASATEKKKAFQEMFGSKDMIIESTFYGDSGFYDVQCFELAPKLYSLDTEWLNKNTKFNLSIAQTIYFAVNDMTNAMHYVKGHESEILGDKAKTAPPMRSIDELAFPLDLIVKGAQKKDKSITSAQVEDFLNLFSCDPGDQLATFNEPGDENIFTYKPIIRLSKDIYFFPNKTFLASAIYKSPLYWMRQNLDYLADVNKHIGRVTEDVTYDYFVNIFGAENVYKDINIVRGKNRVTDIDVMGVVGNTVVIAQNKSKKMTIAALSGDAEAIRADFKKAVIDPYEQGIKVRDTLLGGEAYKLLDAEGNLIILPEGIERAYILCVSNEPYPAVMDQMRVFLPDADKLPPVQLSLFDLDLIAEYLRDPYDFVFYLKQRLENHSEIISSNEIIHLAYHLKYGLFMPKDADMFSLDQSFGQLIDADYYHRKMGTPKPSKKDSLDTRHNNEYEKMINLVKSQHDPKKTDIIFFLKTVPHDVADAVMKQIALTNQQSKDGQYHDFSLQINNGDKPWGGITYMTGSSPEVIKRIRVISSMNKYRAKADFWLSVGARSDGTIMMMGFDDNAWEQADDMDQALEFYQKNTHPNKTVVDDKENKATK